MAGGSRAFGDVPPAGPKFLSKQSEARNQSTHPVLMLSAILIVVAVGSKRFFSAFGRSDRINSGVVRRLRRGVDLG
jgi:hypothetical protein